MKIFTFIYQFKKKNQKLEKFYENYYIFFYLKIDLLH